MALASLCNKILSRRNSFNNKKLDFFHCFFHKLTCTHYFNIRKCLLELQRKQNCVNSYTLFSKLKILNQSIDSSSFSSLMYISVTLSRVHHLATRVVLCLQREGQRHLSMAKWMYFTQQRKNPEFLIANNIEPLCHITLLYWSWS